LRCSYRQDACGNSKRLTGKKIERLHIVGGGSKGRHAQSIRANAMKIPVIAGPTECAALGNILVQAIALGHVESTPPPGKSCAILRAANLRPAGFRGWDAAAKRFEKLLS